MFRRLRSTRCKRTHDSRSTNSAGDEIAGAMPHQPRVLLCLVVARKRASVEPHQAYEATRMQNRLYARFKLGKYQRTKGLERSHKTKKRNLEMIIQFIKYINVLQQRRDMCRPLVRRRAQRCQGSRKLSPLPPFQQHLENYPSALLFGNAARTAHHSHLARLP